ncbi:gp289 [Bacillus phage G]|uniref:Gp289 n=1 Tax=Bacillus phage G TaxID=2884420 RepID=G3MA30_9CAUD|nr:gp289 [Bacillus phage G]AEO93548.1 gp289 [Bacillus phage G]
MKNYFKVTDGQKINSIQNVYLIHSTIMKNLIDTNSYERAMVEVCNDIYSDDELIETIKKLRRKDRLFLCSIIYKWARKEWSHPSLPKNVYRPSTINSRWNALVVDSSAVFRERLSEAFHLEIFKICEHNYNTALMYFHTSKTNKNTYHITMHESVECYWGDVLGRMTLKYNEKQNTLKISYIENIVWKYRRHEMRPQNLKVELFRAVRKLIKQISNEKNKEPKLICHKQYEHLLEDAEKRGYLKKESEEDAS